MLYMQPGSIAGAFTNPQTRAFFTASYLAAEEDP